jgi:hypothetical protein
VVKGITTIMQKGMITLEEFIGFVFLFPFALHGKSSIKCYKVRGLIRFIPKLLIQADRLTPSRETTIFNFVSGDEERDFEGVGGWRSPVLRKKSTLSPAPSSTAGSVENLLMTEKDEHGYSHSNSINFEKDHEEEEYEHGTGPTEHIFSDSSNEIDIDADASDERAWLSLNQRLELPSQPFPLSLEGSPSVQTSGSNTASAATEQGTSRPRHHRRAVTTSSLSPGLSLSPYYYGMGFRRSRSRSNSGSSPVTPPSGEQQQYQHQQRQHHRSVTNQPRPSSVSHNYHHQIYYHHYYNHNPHQYQNQHQTARHIPPMSYSSSTRGNLQTSRSSAGLESLAPLPPLSSSFLMNRPDIRITNKSTNMINSPGGNSSSSSNGPGAGGANPGILPMSMSLSMSTSMPMPTSVSTTTNKPPPEGLGVGSASRVRSGSASRVGTGRDAKRMSTG